MRIIRCIVSLFFLYLIAVEVAVAKEADLVAAGKAALDSFNYERAVTLLEQAIDVNPQNAKAHYYLGTAYGMQAQSSGMLKQASLAKKARLAFEKASQLDPDYLQPRNALIDFYTMAPSFMGGSEEKALEQAAEIRKRDSQQGHRAYARIYMRAKKMDLARNELVQAVREQPTSPKAHQALGNFYMNEKNFPAALHEIEMSLKLDPNYAVGHYRLGQYSARAEKDYARGEAALRRYLTHKPAEDEPGIAAAWYWLGIIQEKQGKKAEAKQSFVTASKLAPHDKSIKEALKRLS